MDLHKQLHGTKMAKGEGVIPYLTRITQIRYELIAVGATIDESELVRIALDGFTKSWDAFIRGVVSREKFPDWQQLWDDFGRKRSYLVNHDLHLHHILWMKKAWLLRAKERERRRKVGRRRTLNFLKSNFFSVTRWETLPHSV
jgi:hypothetical protein